MFSPNGDIEVFKCAAIHPQTQCELCERNIYNEHYLHIEHKDGGFVFCLNCIKTIINNEPELIDL